VTVVDLHPEDLIEKEANGELDAAERARLETHLERCLACRFERQVRADFVEELSPYQPATFVGLNTEPLAVESPSRDSSVWFREPEDVPPASTRRRPPRRRRLRARASWLLAAAALLVGGAAAAMGLGDGQWPRLVGVPSAPSPVRVDERPPPPRRTKLPRLPAAVAELPSAAAVEAPEPLPSPVELSAAPPSRPRRAPAAAEQPPVIGPGDLLDAETGARQRGEYGRALDVHRDLESRYPTSREAQVSRAIVGRLLLDRGDPAGALANFDSYLATGSGELGEEAMIGRATALDHLGRSEEGAQAWSALLTAFPQTPFASHARARSESLNGR
jgi:hypothetical protein